MPTITVYIKMKSYLKDFILGLEDKDGKKLYGPEPVRFSKKERIYQLIDRMRRVPGSLSVVEKPANKTESNNYLAVSIEVSSAKEDELRVFLSKDSQIKIAACIFDIFDATLYDYVNEYILWQKANFPNETPRKSLAYREFCADFNLDLKKIDEDSLRKRFDRRKKHLTNELVKKK